MKRILIRLTPLEPYFFGDENSIKFDNSNSYFVTSVTTPSAMTLMGTLRYTLLEQAGLLHHEGTTREELEKSNVLVGKNSFQPGDAPNYGVLHRVSPLFLMCGEDIYIKTPKNHRGGAVYTPIRMGQTVETSFGSLALPVPGEISSDRLVSEDSWMNLRTGEIRQDLFTSQIQVSVNLKTYADGLLKKSRCCLEEGFCFALIAELAEEAELKDSVCWMGREKSAFRFQVSEGFDLEEAVKNSPLWGGDSVRYALSDLVLSAPPVYDGYAVTGVKNLRYLTTNRQNGYLDIRRGSTLHCVLTAGSVFYGTPPAVLGNDRFGINKILQLGGTEA